MESVLSSIVIGAGQAGLSAAFHLRRLGLRPGVDFVVLDANAQPGGAWQHRWSSLVMADVHGIAALPGLPVPAVSGAEQANAVLPLYFGDYERRHALEVVRPVHVLGVDGGDGSVLRVSVPGQSWSTRSLINATGTWERPFIPYYPGMGSFAGRQLHTHDYDGPAQFAGQHVVVVGGGASAVQILAEISEAASTTWVTRRPPVWRTTPFTEAVGRAAVALVEDRVRRGLLPLSVVSVTGLVLREQEENAFRRGVYRPDVMFDHLTETGVEWSDGRRRRADAIVWATGFRPDVAHLVPLGLRTAAGGIQLDGTTAVRDPRIQLVGYGPSASTIGANRAGREAAVNVTRLMADWAA